MISDLVSAGDGGTMWIACSEGSWWMWIVPSLVPGTAKRSCFVDWCCSAGGADADDSTDVVHEEVVAV